MENHDRRGLEADRHRGRRCSVRPRVDRWEIVTVIDYQYFSDDEFERIGSDSNRMNISMMGKLIKLRDEINQPLPLTSAWRSESRNRQVGGAKNSAHLYGRAVDLRVHGDTAFRVLSMAARFGFTGIGIHQRGIIRGRFLHLDDMEFSENLLRPTIWSYS